MRGWGVVWRGWPPPDPLFPLTSAAVLRRVVPVEGLGVDELLVLGRVVDREAVLDALEAVLHDQRRGYLAQNADHRQLLGPDVEELFEQIVALLLVRLERDLVPGIPDLADPVIRRRLLGVGVLRVEPPEAPGRRPWPVERRGNEDQRGGERQQRAVAAPEAALDLVGVVVLGVERTLDRLVG